MCYHTQIPRRDELISAFAQDYELIAEYDNYYHANGFDHVPLPVITSDKPGKIQFFKWGLIPTWIKGREEALQIWDRTLSATCEKVFELPSFKESIYTKRCLIIINGFYENRHEGKNKYPYFIYLKDKKPFFLGGLWSDWIDKSTGEIVQTCAVITTPANSLMEKIHNTKKRMPLIIDRAEANKWLDSRTRQREIVELMRPFDDSKMESHTISRLINYYKTKNTNVPEICETVEYPELVLLNL